MNCSRWKTLQLLAHRFAVKFARTTALSALLVGMMAVPASAAFITPTGVSSTSFYAYGQHPLNLINGAVTSAATSQAANAGATGMWHGGAVSTGGANGFNVTGAPVVNNQALIFTLPGTYNLTQADIWQMNQTGSFGRGVNQYDLLVSADGVNYTTAFNNGTLAIATGAVTAQTPAVVQNNVRFVKLEIDTAHSAAPNEYVGLTEVRFEGTLVTNGPVLTVSSATTSAGLAQQPSSAINDVLQGKVGVASATPLGGGTVAQLTDGLGTNNLAHRVLPADGNAIRSFTYDSTALGLAANETLSINKINVFGYNTDARRVNDFDVEYTLDGVNWQYAFIGAANGLTPNAVTLSSLARTDALDFITDVKGLRFDFRPISGTLQSSLIEIDVFGTVVVPEPSTFAMLMFGGVFLWFMRKKG